MDELTDLVVESALLELAALARRAPDGASRTPSWLAEARRIVLPRFCRSRCRANSGSRRTGVKLQPGEPHMTYLRPS